MKGGHVYIIGSSSGTLYIGVTSDLYARVLQHRSGEFAGFSKRYHCTGLLYSEGFSTIIEAITREKQLKGWRREKKIALINKMNPRWVDLFDEITADYDMDLLNKEKVEPLIVKSSKPLWKKV